MSKFTTNGDDDDGGGVGGSDLIVVVVIFFLLGLPVRLRSSSYSTSSLDDSFLYTLSI